LNKTVYQALNKLISPFFKIDYLNKIIQDRNSVLFKYRALFAPKTYKSNSQAEIKDKNIDGIKFHLDVSDYMEWKIYYELEKHLSEKVLQYVQKEDIILDVGANIGFYSLTLANHAQQGKVLSFEPNKFIYNKLQQNIDSNTLRNIKTYNFGLGEETGKFQMDLSDSNNRGSGYVSNQTNSSESNSIEIYNLNEIFESLDIPRIDFIKIDIEGYEYNFLQGANNLIEKFKPTIFIEICDQHLRRQCSSANELISYLQSLGYSSIVNMESEEVISPNSKNYDNCQFDAICQ